MKSPSPRRWAGPSLRKVRVVAVLPAAVRFASPIGGAFIADTCRRTPGRAGHRASPRRSAGPSLRSHHHEPDADPEQTASPRRSAGPSLRTRLAPRAVRLAHRLRLADRRGLHCGQMRVYGLILWRLLRLADRRGLHCGPSTPYAAQVPGIFASPIGGAYIAETTSAPTSRRAAALRLANRRGLHCGCPGQRITSGVPSDFASPIGGAFIADAARTATSGSTAGPSPRRSAGPSLRTRLDGEGAHIVRDLRLADRRGLHCGDALRVSALRVTGFASPIGGAFIAESTPRPASR